MSSYSFAYSYTGTGHAANLTNSLEGAYVAAGVLVASDDSVAIYGTSNGHLVTVRGTVIGHETGIELGDDPGDTYERVNVAAGAEVYGYQDGGITIQASFSRVNNAGYVYGTNWGIGMSGEGPGSGRLVNSGTIEGYYSGVLHDGTESFILNNSGRISAELYSYYDQGSGGATVVNTGGMVGAAIFGTGNDTFDTSHGAIAGAVSMGDGEDTVYGSAAADSILGGYGDDLVRGNGGRDQLSGGMGFDTADYREKTASVAVTLQGAQGATVFVNGVAEDRIQEFEAVAGGSAGDRLIGDSVANQFWGFNGNDTLAGGAGRDTLSGGAGADTLTGGSGQDQFWFDSNLGSGNIDRITDFSHADDTIGLDHAVFQAIPTWSAAGFRVVSSGHDAAGASQHIIYNKTDGSLWYDDDGNGAHAAVQFATLVNHPVDLSYNDFMLLS